MFDLCNSIFRIWHILQHSHHQNSSLYSSPYSWSLFQFCPPPTSFPLVAITLFSASTCLFYSYSLIGFYISHISETIQYFFPTRCLLSALFFSPLYLGCLFSFSSVTQSCLTLCDPINCSTPGLPVHHQLPESTQTYVHRVSDAIQPSHPLSSPSPPAPNPSQHQSLFQWVNSSHEGAKVLEFQPQHQSFQWTPRTDLL